MNGMAEVIAGHNGYDTYREDRFGHQIWYVVCDGCDWRQDLQDAPATDHAAHMAEELTKAGYGKLEEAKAETLREIAVEWAAYQSARMPRSDVLQVPIWLNQRADSLEAQPSKS